MSLKKQAANWAALFLGLGIVAFVGVRAGSSFVATKRSLQLQITARDTISEQLRGVVTSVAVLKMAARIGNAGPGNQELAACLNPESSCTVTSPEKQMQFLLKDSVAEDGRVLAGTNENPGVYSIRGKLSCIVSEDEGCPGWLSHIWFWADCPDGRSECQQAERIWVRYQVSPSEAYKDLPSLPPADLFNNSSNSFTFSTLVSGS